MRSSSKYELINDGGLKLDLVISLFSVSRRVEKILKQVRMKEKMDPSRCRTAHTSPEDDSEHTTSTVALLSPPCCEATHAPDPRALPAISQGWLNVGERKRSKSARTTPYYTFPARGTSPLEHYRDMHG